MNGREIENLLTLIDQNIESTSALMDREVVAYVQQNEQEVLASLRRNGVTDIPTSVGTVRFHLDQLEAVAA